MITGSSSARDQRLKAERTELIGWLAGAVAHDVNNVLTAIAGYVELIEADLSPDDPHMDDAAGIREAVVRAGSLVRQLMLVGRRQALRLEPLDTVDLITGLLPLISSACGGNVAVRLETDGRPAGIVADRSLLEQALLNLAVNARDAMPDGGTLTLRVRSGSLHDRVGTSLSGGAQGVHVDVEDTGVGIDPSILPHVFEPFFSTKSPEHGSGIGLAAVEEATAKCGGSVSVDSRPGRGTRFTLHLPGAAPPPARQPAPSGTPCRASRGTGTVLVVDPDPEVRLLLVRFLRRLGYTAVDAASPRQALALAEHALGPIDLLVTELALPEIPGAELATRIRERQPSLPVLYLSRAAYNPGRQQLDVVRCDRVLAKPFTLEVLGGAIRMLLDAGARRQIED